MVDRTDSRVYSFGAFVLDGGRGTLSRGGEALKLRPKSFQVLEFLLEHWGRVVGKQEVMDAVWADVAVTEDSLVQCLMDIRKALGEEGSGYIRTVPRRGYIFEAPEVAAAAGTGQTGAGWGVWRWVALSVVAALAGLGVWSVAGSRPGGEPQTVLILPFAVTGSADDAAMRLGLTDQLISRLGRVSSLVVRPMGAAERYLEGTVDPVEAGKAQRVDYVLEGSIREVEGEQRASVRLWSVGEGRVKWARTFDEPGTRLLELESAIAGRIVEALELQLTTEERRRLSAKAVNPEAAALYARGYHHRDQGTRADIEKAEKFFKAAIEADPGFARAYVGLADTYLDFSSPVQGEDRAATQQMLLTKALELDKASGEAHAALALMKLGERDYAGAEAEAGTALRLEANSPYVVFVNMKLRRVLGDEEQALVYARRWCELDPLSSRACEQVAATLSSAGRYDEAETELRKLLAGDPGFAPAHTALALSYLGRQRYQEAIAELEDVMKQERAPERVRFTMLAFAYARSGRAAEARAMLAEMSRERERRAIPPQFFAVVHAGLGERDRAFALLDEAYPDRPGERLVRIDQPAIDIALEMLRGDARYREFGRKKGFKVR